MSQKIFSCEYVAIEHITQTASNNIFFMVAHFFFYMSVKTALHLKFGKRLLPTSFKVSMSFKVLCLISVLPMFRVCTAWRCFTKYTLQIYRFLRHDSFHEHYFCIFFSFLFNRSRFGVFPGQKAFPLRLIPVPFPFSVCPLSENDKKGKNKCPGQSRFFGLATDFPKMKTDRKNHTRHVRKNIRHIF